MTKTIRNRARCRNCNDVIESKHRHDFVVCTCWAESHTAVDKYKGKKYTAGNRYTKKYKKFLGTLHGIAIDGGRDYFRCSFLNSNDLEYLS